MDAAEEIQQSVSLFVNSLEQVEDGINSSLLRTEDLPAHGMPQACLVKTCRGEQQRSRRAATTIATLLLLGAAIFACASVYVARPAASGTAGIVGLSTVLAITAQKKDQYLGCAVDNTENCSASHCCQDIGHQCYEKAPGWAVCRTSCDQRKMQEQDPARELWSCKPLGERRRCANATDNCMSFGCCSAPGTQCYAKDNTRGSCLESCDSEAMQKLDIEKELWSCRAIGERNFVTKCAWAGEDCATSTCCNNEGFVCALQDKTSTACTQTVQKDRWISQKISIPSYWNGRNGKVLGEGRSEFEVKPAHKGEKTAGTSLFCLMVYLPNSTEETLVKLAEKNGVSVFGCDDSMTVHAWKSQDSDWDLAASTILNTEVFLSAWQRVRQDGRFAQHDWTLKADPDCVFFADRVRSHLVALRPPAQTPLYLKNNDMEPGLGNKGFLGAIEVFSTMAMQTYFANAAGCQRTLGTNCGEDTFFKACMDALGVGFMTDSSIFAPDYNPQVCSKAGRAAFHPFRAANEWQCCVDIVQGLPRHVAYGKCTPTYMKRPWMTKNNA